MSAYIRPPAGRSKAAFMTAPVSDARASAAVAPRLAIGDVERLLAAVGLRSQRSKRRRPAAATRRTPDDDDDCTLPCGSHDRNGREGSSELAWSPMARVVAKRSFGRGDTWPGKQAPRIAGDALLPGSRADAGRARTHNCLCRRRAAVRDIHPRHAEAPLRRSERRLEARKGFFTVGALARCGRCSDWLIATAHQPRRTDRTRHRAMASLPVAGVHPSRQGGGRRRSRGQ